MMTVEHLIILIFAIYHVFSEASHAKERKDLYTKLMAGSLQEYQQQNLRQNPPNILPRVLNPIKKGLEEYADGKFSR